MFVSIKSLTALIDESLTYLAEGRLSPNYTKEYEQLMQDKLTSRLNMLKEISSNKKLINKYTCLVNDMCNN